MALDGNLWLEKLYWQKLRKQVYAVNPILAKHIDKLNPSHDLPFYIARYQYGDLIIKNGILQVHTDDSQLHSLLDPKVPTEIAKHLGYDRRQLPLGLVLENSIEVGFTPHDFACPMQLYEAGSIFALWTKLDAEITLHPSKIFSVHAGARCIFMLPKVGARELCQNLQRELAISISPPKTLNDHHQLFVELSKQKEQACDWRATLLFFPHKWIKKLRSNDQAFLPLKNYLYHVAWQKTSYWRNKIYFDSAFSRAQANRNLKPNPYVADTVKYLLAIGVGAMPAFTSAYDNKCAPVNTLQNIFLQNYRLKKYLPTIMYPAYFQPRQDRPAPVYYSLRYPIAPEFSPRSRKEIVPLNDLRELKHILMNFIAEINEGKVGIEDTLVGFVAKYVNFDFFHGKLDRSAEVRLAAEMPQEDPQLLNCLVPCKNEQFAVDSPFLQGVVRIARIAGLKKSEENGKSRGD